MLKQLEIVHVFRKLLQHFLMLFTFIVLSACGEAVENLEERLRQEKIASTSTITSVSPAYGSTSGGGTLTLNGSNLDLVTSVSLGDGTCTIATLSSSILTCTLSSASAGSKNITINNSKGESFTFSNGYRYLAAPTISSVTPAVGSVAGSESITLTGTGFYQISSIDIGGSACTSVVTVSSTTATCTTGANTAGSYTITVTNVDSQTGTLVSGYDYVDPPTITSFSPTTLEEAGGQTLTINGTNFDGSTTSGTVEIGGFDCPVATNTGTVITCTTIPYWSTSGTGTSRYGAFGSDVTVVVSNADGGTDSDTIEYVPAVTLTSIDQAYGSINGGDTITITGDWFDSGGSFDVTMAGVSCATATVVDRNTITCVTDVQTAQTGDVVVTNFDGQQATLTNAFTYRPAPTITSVTPGNGPESGGGTVSVTGTGFDSAGNFTVLFGAANCTNITNVTSTSFDCDVPANTAGTYNVTVTNTDDNQAGVGVGAYIYNPAPTVTIVTTPVLPFIDYGPVAGGNTIQVQGTNFQTGLTVELSDENGTFQTCGSLSNLTATRVDCVAPAVGAATLSNVRVTNPDGQAFTLASAYTYRPAPVISSIYPFIGPTGGGQEISVYGSYLMPNVSIDIDGQTCSVTTYVSENEVRCTTPNYGSASALLNVDVTNEDGQTDQLASSYEFVLDPDLTVTSPATTPTSSDIAGGTSITITGANFHSSGVSVTIDGDTCTNVNRVNATTITCDTPAHSSGEDYVVRVTNTVSGQFGDSAAFFDFIGPPTLTNIYEETGTTIIDGGNDNGGYKIRLIGTDFQTGMSVTVGDATCAAEGVGVTDSQFVDNNTFDCYIPAGSYSLQDVVLTNQDGQTSTSSSAFIFRPAPTFASVSPDYSDPLGGSTVTISGANFTGANMEVRIDGTACSSTTFVDANTLTCVTPAHALATGLNIEIVNSGDLQTTGSVGSFDYIGAPSISSITVPNPIALYSNENIAEAGGENIIITGTDLRSDATVTIGTDPCTYVSDTEPTSYTCTTPAGTGDPITVTYTNADGQSDTAQLRYVAAPTITGYDYAYGPVAGGNTINVQGTGFQASATVSINGVACTSSTVNSTTDIDCVVPADGGAGIGTYDVVVTNDDAQTVTDSGAFAYVADPAISSTNPTTIYEVGSQTLVITGTDLYDNATVTIDSNPCTITSNSSPTSITCTTPAGTGTGVTLLVTNESGQTGSTTIDYLPAPTVTAVDSPTDADGGRSDGSQTITITGTNFISGDTSHTVDLAGSPCTVISVPTTTSLTCTSSAGSSTSTVTVTNPDGQVSNAYASFTYHPAVDITSVSPIGGPAAGANSITISGSGLRDSTLGGGVVTVDIGGIGCTVTAVAGDGSSVTCTVAAGPQTPGDYDITVTNGDGRTDTLTGIYKIIDAPTVTNVTPSTAPESLATTLTITGTGFQNYGTDPTVTVDGEACTSVSVASDTSLTCTTAPSATTDTTRMVEVIVISPDTQQGSDSSAFLQYIARPHVTSIDVSVVQTGGGDTINITGSNFVSGATVEVGVNCATTTFNSATSLTCVTASASAGTYDLVVTNPDGQVDDDTNNVIVSPPPTVTSISDDHDAIAGGKSVVISGSDFAAVSSVTLAGTACSITAQNSTSVTCTTGSVGADTIGDVVVTNGNGITGTLSNGFEYEDTPTFTSLTDGSDDQGSVVGGEAITISGSNFATGVSVTIDGNPCTSLVRTNSTSISCLTPAGGAPGAVDVIITNQSGLTVTATNGYTYVGASPSITSISPQGGDTAGGTTVTITGSNFVSGATVAIGGACTNYDYSGVPTTIVCDTANNGVEAFEDVVVTNPDLSTDTLTNGFLFTDSPTVTNISPATGSTAGGTVVTVTGTNFDSGQYSMNIGGVACTGISHISPTQFSCTLGASSAGTYDVNVVQYFQTATLGSSFTYANGANLTWQSTATYDYGTQSTNVSATFTLENTGPTATTADIAVSTGSTEFSVTSDNCSGTSLSSGATCTVDVTFMAQFLSTGSYSATLEATASDGGTTQRTIQGTK